MRILSVVSEKKWTQAFRADARTKQGGMCCYCREPLTSATVTADHVVPRVAGGQTRRENIKAACNQCNLAKGGMSEKMFMSLIKGDFPREASGRIQRTWMRRKIWVRTHRACERIARAVGMKL